MHINFFISSLSGGGAERVLNTLATCFTEYGDKVGIVSLEKRPQFYKTDPRVTLTRIDHNGEGKIKGLLGDFIDLKRFIVRENADINISFLSRCNLLLLIVSLLTGAKVVACDRNNPLREHSRLVFWASCQLYRRASAIVVQTEKIRSFYPSYLQNKIVVIENPLDADSLRGQVAGESINPDKSVVSLGRLEPQKDYRTLIRAFALASKSHPDWKLRIYGIGDMRDEIQALIDELGLSSLAALCGRTEKPFFELSRAGIFVLSSNYEGFPNVLCEAMLAGKPCISTDCVSGPSELVEDGCNGFLVPVGDAETMAKKLKQLYEDKRLRMTLGANASKTVKRLSIDRIFSNWNNLVRNIKN